MSVTWHNKGQDIQLCYQNFPRIYLCSLDCNLAHKQNLTFCQSVFLLTVHAMQVESGIPPLQTWLDYMNRRVAARLAAKINPTNPIHGRLPTHLQWEDDGQDTTPLPLPIRPTRRKPGMPSKFKSSTIQEITSEILGKVERITPAHTLPPWRTDTNDLQYTTRLMTHPA